MHQLLVLTADDWTTLRRGGTIPFRIGDGAYALITEGGFGGLSSDVFENGSPPLPVKAAGHRSRPTRRHYTTAEKRKILAAMDKASERGETQRAALTRMGVPANSGSPYVWRREFAAAKKKGG